ncbi:MAG: DUF1015 domain-containing protein [Candidatus Absconditabacterales bacterium]
MKLFFEDIGVKIPEIYLPNKNIDMKKRSVVACDQYTSQPEYWQEVEKFCKGNLSTLNIVFPEIYLEDKDKEEKIQNIQKNMKEYLAKGILENIGHCFVYVDRKTSEVQSRKGLIVTLDLEKYDYNKGSKTLIRATEGTVLDRLPPRIKIRENASLESPHIMVLIDDEEYTVINPLEKNLEKLEKLYDFDLMMNGGHIRGYKINDEEIIENIINALEKLKERSNLLFAVGDGNHSLATAKAIWENKKITLSDKEKIDHPARFALVELVNVHDEGLEFHPIHRILFNVDYDKLFGSMSNFYKKIGSTFELHFDESEKDELKELKKLNDVHFIKFVNNKGTGYIKIKNPKANLEVGTLQIFLDEFLKNNSESKIDYVHGKKVVDEIGTKDGNIGFYLPVMDKKDLFRTVIIDGALPRKTFSMGEAEEKRFYLECRKIIE